MLQSIVYERAMAISFERERRAAARVRHNTELLPAPEMSDGQLTTLLKNKAFLPEASYGDLLAAIQSGQRAYRAEVLKVQQKSYNQLNWFQKLFAEVPSSKIIPHRTIPADYLMHRYQGKVDAFELFNALCELGEHRLITLDTQHPYRVGLTNKGRKIMQLLKDNTEPPAYQDVFQSGQNNAS